MLSGADVPHNPSGFMAFNSLALEPEAAGDAKPSTPRKGPAFLKFGSLQLRSMCYLGSGSEYGVHPDDGHETTTINMTFFRAASSHLTMR